VVIDDDASDPPPRAVEERKVAKKSVAPEPTTSEATSGLDDAVRREAMLVGEAKKALRDGDGSHVLELVSRADREFPKGQLVQERRALEIRALAQLGRADEAAAKADKFLAKYPSSPYADAVERAVGR
jgi:outer membrane protein assembly factor BamD (BamD/ComL family)